MMNVDEIIGSLLLRHNCVIIPGFGGFVAKQTSARIDYASGVMTPPSKSLLFNRQLISNDGLLVAHYAQHNGVSYDSALEEVEKHVSTWRNELSAGNRISIDKVGFLFFDQERNICFEQDRFFNLLLSSYGLGNVHFLSEMDVAIAQRKAEKEEQKEAIIRESVQEAVVPVVEEIFIKPVVTSEEASTTVITEVEKSTVEIANPFVAPHKTKGGFWKYAAAACLIPVVFYSMWIPMKTDVLESKMISFQDFNPFHNAEDATYEQKTVSSLVILKDNGELTLEQQIEQVETAEGTYSYNLTDETFVQVKLEEKKIVEQAIGNNSTTVQQEVKEVKSTVSATPVVQTNQGSLNYIIGCFSDDVNANTLVNELKAKGFKAFVKDKKNGLTRVSIGAASTQEEMNQLINKANAAGYTGWILK